MESEVDKSERLEAAVFISMAVFSFAMVVCTAVGMLPTYSCNCPIVVYEVDGQRGRTSERAVRVHTDTCLFLQRGGVDD